MELNIKLDNLDIEHLENLSDEIIEMTECPAKYISPYALRQIYRKLVKLRELLFQMETKSKNVNDFRNAAIVKRMAIHFLLERCYWIHYNDSEMVSDLLKMLFQVDGHLGKVFDFQQLSVSSRKSEEDKAVMDIETTWSEGTLSSEKVYVPGNVSSVAVFKIKSDINYIKRTSNNYCLQKIHPFAYFLEQTNKAKVLFEDQRLAEKYFVQSVHCQRLSNNLLVLPPSYRTFRFPDMLITFLEYGLFVNSKPYENVIGKLLTGIIGVILNFSENSSDCNSDYTKRIIKAGNVLLRAVSRVNMSGLLKAQRLTVREKEKMTRSIVQEMSVPALLPQLKFRCTGPQDLQHQCRRTIRRALYDNWKLPQGIALLPLPTLMKDYINLRYD